MPKTTTDWAHLRKEMAQGEWDEFLTRLIAEAARRKNVLATENANTLMPGDTIFISDTCKPKMLAGAPVIYRGREGTKLKVELTRGYSAKWKKGAVILIPHSLVGEIAHS